MPPSHIFVTAPEGRLCPIHPADGRNHETGGLLYVEHGKVERVKYSGDVRRAWKRGDLVLVDRQGAKVKTFDQAAAPAEIAELADKKAPAPASAPDADKKAPANAAAPEGKR